MIYAVHIQNSKWIKIGFTDESCARRIAQLQTGNPYEIEVLFTVDGSLKQEQALHEALWKAFDRIRIPTPANEWYPGRNGFFQSFLSQLRLGTNVGLAFLDRYNPAVKQPGKVTPEIAGPLMRICNQGPGGDCPTENSPPVRARTKKGPKGSPPVCVIS